MEKTGDGKELAAGCKIYYTVDGSDPRTSDTAIEYTQKFRVPLGTIVKATLKTDRFAGSLYEFDYSKDHDTVPGTVQSFDFLPKITVPLYTSPEDLGLPTAMIVKLSDGREKYVAVNWDISSYDSGKIDTYTLSGTFELPDYITNPNQINASKPQITVSNVPSTGMVGKMIQLPGAVVTDDVSLNLTANILVSGPKGEQITLNNSSFIPQTAGIYTVTYSAVDEDNNRNSLSFEINVVPQQSQTDTDNTQQPNETETAKTGESKNIGWFFTTVLGSAAVLILILQYRKKRKTSSTNQ